MVSMTFISMFMAVIVIHLLADFNTQTHEQSQGKGEGNSIWNKWLAYHVGTYTLTWCMFFGILPFKPEYQNFTGLMIFALSIGIPHYVVDWFTSRIGKPFWKKTDFHNGFVTVGYDQVIHYFCLLAVLTKMLNLTI